METDKQKIFDIVVKYLYKQQERAIYSENIESRKITNLVDDKKLPDIFDLLNDLRKVHDYSEMKHWPSFIEMIASKHRLNLKNINQNN